MSWECCGLLREENNWQLNSKDAYFVVYAGLTVEI